MTYARVLEVSELRTMPEGARRVIEQLIDAWISGTDSDLAQALARLDPILARETFLGLVERNLVEVITSADVDGLAGISVMRLASPETIEQAVAAGPRVN
jgi:hypothetical protein